MKENLNGVPTRTCFDVGLWGPHENLLRNGDKRGQLPINEVLRKAKRLKRANCPRAGVA